MINLLYPIIRDYQIKHLLLLLCIITWIIIKFKNINFVEKFIDDLTWGELGSVREVISRKTDENTYVLVIGDSNDLYLVLDWCRADESRMLCHISSEGDPSRDPWYSPRDSDNCSAYLDSLSKQNVQIPLFWKSKFSPRWCRDSRRNVTLLMIWQSLGVFPIPFDAIDFDPVKDYLPATTESMTAGEALTVVLEPIIDIVPKLLGNKPNGILIQSMFWDLYHLVIQNFTRYEELRINLKSRLLWGAEWVKNFTEYVNVIKSKTKKWNVSWLGIRTANLVDDNAHEKEWRNGANTIIPIMNKYLREFAFKSSIPLFDLENHTGSDPAIFLRDTHHPKREYLVAAMELIVREIIRSRS